MDWFWDSIGGSSRDESLGIEGLILLAWLILIALSYVLSTISVLALSVLSLARTRFGLQAVLWWTQTLAGVALIGTLWSLPFALLLPFYLNQVSPLFGNTSPAGAFEIWSWIYVLIVLVVVVVGALAILLVGQVTRLFAWIAQASLDRQARRIASNEIKRPFVLLLRPFTSDETLSAQTDSAFRLGIGFRRMSSAIAVFLLRLASPRRWGSLTKTQQDEEGADEWYDSKLENFVEKMTTLSSRFHPFDTEVAIADAVRPIGPLIAVGRPKSLFCGAGRVQVSDAEWQRVVSDLASRASAIVFIPGHGEGTHWEIANIASAHMWKTVFVMLPNVVMSDVGGVTNADPLFPSLSRPADEIAGLGDNEKRRRATFDPGDWVDAARAAKKLGLGLPEAYNLRGGAFYLGDDGWRRQGAFSVLFPGAVTRCCKRILRRPRTT